MHRVTWDGRHLMLWQGAVILVSNSYLDGLSVRGEDNPGVCVARHQDVTKADLPKIVSRVCAYPAEYLTSRAERVLAYLAAFSGAHLLSGYKGSGVRWNTFGRLSSMARVLRRNGRALARYDRDVVGTMAEEIMAIADRVEAAAETVKNGSREAG
jgi:hypothetical protein